VFTVLEIAFTIIGAACWYSIYYEKKNLVKNGKPWIAVLVHTGFILFGLSCSLVARILWNHTPDDDFYCISRMWFQEIGFGNVLAALYVWGAVNGKKILINLTIRCCPSNDI
jgi:hypothetical protein